MIFFIWLWWSFGLYKDEIIIGALMATPRDFLGSSSRKANRRRWTRSRPDSNFSSLVTVSSIILWFSICFSFYLSEIFLAMMLYDSSLTSNSMKLSPLDINFIGPHVFAIEIDWNNNWYEHTQHSEIFAPAHYITQSSLLYLPIKSLSSPSC